MATLIYSANRVFHHQSTNTCLLFTYTYEVQFNIEVIFFLYLTLQVEIGYVLLTDSTSSSDFLIFVASPPSQSFIRIFRLPFLILCLGRQVCFNS